ncbi:hypothetical protein H8356DRAFT_1322208 [Neocallimastix lanati (nom. inval.)]|nr:hypothetical protein H8356DRAFT_1322208 [Neocallimastix sp. JGI-2020a]
METENKYYTPKNSYYSPLDINSNKNKGEIYYDNKFLSLYGKLKVKKLYDDILRKDYKSGVQFHLTTHNNPLDSVTLNRTSHLLHYNRASQFGVIPAYCKSSIVNGIHFLIWKKVIVCSCGLPYPTSPNLVSVDAEMLYVVAVKI